MKKTKRITLSALLVALGAVLMALGSFVEVLDLTVSAIASLIVVFVYLEIGSPFTWLVWLATSLVAFLIAPGSTVWLTYLIVFGIYPILKAYVERLPRPLWLVAKLAYVNAVIWALFFLVELLFSVPFFNTDALWLKIALYVLINVAFVAYDAFITVAVRIYLAKYRRRLSRFLK